MAYQHAVVAGLIQRESARVSPFDPVAGNPSSLMARAVAYDFFNAITKDAVTEAMRNPRRIRTTARN